MVGLLVDLPGAHCLDVMPEIAGENFGPKRLDQTSVESLNANNGDHVKGDIYHRAVCYGIWPTWKMCRRSRTMRKKQDEQCSLIRMLQNSGQ